MRDSRSWVGDRRRKGRIGQKMDEGDQSSSLNTSEFNII